MKSMIFHALIALAALAFVGCSKKDDAQQVNVDVISITAAEAQMTKQIVVSSNTSWTATGQTDWCKVSPASGEAGDTPVTVTIDANSDYDTRTATLAFVGTEAKSENIVVTQTQKNAIELQKKDYDFDFKGGALDVTPQSNVDFTVDIVVTGDDQWIKQVESRALVGKALYFDVAKNLTGTARTAKIELKNAEKNVLLTLNVAQSADGEIDIPDADFKAILVSKYDKNSDGKIFLSEVKDATTLDLRDKRLKSVEGIAYMPALKVLYLDYNDLAEIDLNGNTALTSVSAQGQGSAMSDYENLNPTLTSVKAEKCTKLTTFDVGFNPLLKTLNVSSFVALENLTCSECGLSALDITKNEALLEVYCSNNALTTLDLSNNRLLGTLNCSSNKLTTLDVSACTGMKTLNARSNPDLKEIWLQTNQTINRLQKDSATEVKYK